MPLPFYFCTYEINAGLAVFFYPADKERVQFSGVKSEEGLSKFLVKNLGDSILVGSISDKHLKNKLRFMKKSK